MKRFQLVGFAVVLGVFSLFKTASTLATSRPLAQSPTAAVQKIPLVFSGGHETDPRDNGRPVTLIASALGVPPEVFREAFSHVRPAPAGEQPNDEDVRRNKDALLQALGRYGVTNEKLDEVSNYYRYNRSRGEMWPTEAAQAFAVLKNGKLVGLEIQSGGSGYSSIPTVTVPGVKTNAWQIQLSSSQKFEKNGAIASIIPPTH